MPERCRLPFSHLCLPRAPPVTAQGAGLKRPRSPAGRRDIGTAAWHVPPVTETPCGIIAGLLVGLVRAAAGADGRVGRAADHIAGAVIAGGITGISGSSRRRIQMLRVARFAANYLAVSEASQWQPIFRTWIPKFPKFPAVIVPIALRLGRFVERSITGRDLGQNALVWLPHGGGIRVDEL